MISAAAEARTSEAVCDFVCHCGETKPYIFGTAALREAKNGREVAARIAKQCGHEVRIISGEEEAAITWRGALMGLTPPDHAMVLDIGGGSTEFTMGPTLSRSLPLGSVRQTERHIRTDPPSPDEVRSMETEIRGLVEEGIRGFEVKALIGVAGSVTQLAALELQLAAYDPMKTHAYVLSLATVSTWVERFATLAVEKRRALPGMVPARADTVLAGSIILRETIRALGLDGVTVSEFDSLWGAL